ncbi:MAG: hypothetical protein AAGI01_11005 [Myxococcota bacterium]
MGDVTHPLALWRSVASPDLRAGAGALLTFGVTSLLAACAPNNPAGCAAECDDGFTCDVDSGRCVAQALPPWEESFVPGRAARIVAVDEDIFVATLAPEARAVLVGQASSATGAPVSFEVLANRVRPASRRLGLAADGSRAAVAWIDVSGAFHVATRERTAEAAWSIDVARVGAQLSYRASDDFDIALTEDGVLHIVFRGADNTLEHLFRPVDGREWAAELVDDGSRVADGECPTSVRLARGGGVGVEPDALGGAQLRVAYHDADCGTLRLARLVERRWSVSVVDNTSTQGAVGRFPSLAQTPNGELAVAYQDLGRTALVFAREQGSGFAREVVTQGARSTFGTSQSPRRISGAFTRLSFDASGRAVISFFDASEVRARVVRSSSSERSPWEALALDDPEAADVPRGFFADHARTVSDDIMLVFERLVPGDGGRLSSRLGIIEGVAR